MEISIPRGAYTGKPTPFGGPSLEWEFEIPILDGEYSDDARISVRGLPIIINSIISHLRRHLSDEFPKSSANVQRKVLTVGIPIIGRIVSNHPSVIGRIDRAIMESSESEMRDLLMKQSNHYILKLGEKSIGQHAIFARNKEQTSIVKNISEDIGLPVSQVTILCLSAGLAQSLDPMWIPLKWRGSFVREVRFFEKWMREF